MSIWLLYCQRDVLEAFNLTAFKAETGHKEVIMTNIAIGEFILSVHKLKNKSCI